MKNRKRFFCLLTLALLSLALLAGCGSKDSDLQDTDGIIYEYDSIGAGSIMRNGEQIEVLFFNDQETVYIYYNDFFYDLKEPKLLDKAELPTYELHDTDWYAESFYTGDDTGDDNSDLRVTLRHADYSASYIVWTWDNDKGFVYQPDESRFYDPGVVEDQSKYRFMVYGRWSYGFAGQYDCIDIDGEGNWQLWFNGDVIDEGDLYYLEEQGYAVYIRSKMGSDINGGGICVESSGLCFSDDAVGLDGGRLYFSDYGCFSYLDGRDGQWHGDGGGNWDEEYRGDSEVYRQDISAFEGA